MAAHTTAQFNLFMSQLRETNATLDFYCDFPKIARNVADIEISLNMLNYLIGKENLREAVEALWNRDKRAFDVMDILIATRKKDDKKYIDNDGSMHSVHSLFSSVEGVMKFIEGTGLDAGQTLRVETGLDTNARKNRSGEITETLVARIFDNAGIKYREQVSSKEFPAISAVLGADQKVFDFVIAANGKTLIIILSKVRKHKHTINKIKKFLDNFIRRIVSKNCICPNKAHCRNLYVKLISIKGFRPLQIRMKIIPTTRYNLDIIYKEFFFQNIFIRRLAIFVSNTR